MSDLIVRSHTPFNAETPPDRLRASFITAPRDFYVRSHGAVPVLSADRHRLKVRGRVAAPLDLSIQALREGFAARTVTAVMQCAGNRRADMHRVRPVTGDPWNVGAIGNAAWTGVSLAEVLHAAGADTDPTLHVAFESVDTVHGGARYGASIPMTKALCPEVLLAFAMNNQTLTAEHGFPLRAVVPGFAGVRSPKWLASITVQDQPSDSPIQQIDYKLLPPSMVEDSVDWSQGVPIDEMPLNAAICQPIQGAKLLSGPVPVSGYAIATGRTIARVDLSTDGGRHWLQATLEHHPDAPWSWTFWSATIDLPAGEHELAVRAWDSAGQTQPSAVEDTWNFKGYLCAAWHRVRVEVA